MVATVHPVRSRARASLVAALLALSPVLAGCSETDQGGRQAEGGKNLLAQTAQTLPPNPRLSAAAAQATADGRSEDAARLDRLREVPTGFWLTPERYPTDLVASYVTDVLEGAAGTVPVFVLYGIPDRDCTGGLSSGGLTHETYLPWVEAIATAAGESSVVVLEPDAIASTTSCAPADRLPLLRRAVEVLSAAGITTYLDAGHSYWIPASDMADLLRQAGIEQARGFATNVANYQPESAERAYAAELSGLLEDTHYVIDTGRSGDPTGTQRPVEEWCNPSGQSLGSAPGFVDDDSGLDALLWIKPPAESDGTCNGGPPAGEIWIDRALALTRTTGW